MRFGLSCSQVSAEICVFEQAPKYIQLVVFGFSTIGHSGSLQHDCANRGVAVLPSSADIRFWQRDDSTP